MVASCSYEARAFGVRSAMPMVRARALCPTATYIDGHHGRYREVSGQLHEILRSATPLVEPIGLDEAFLDVTGSRRLLGSPRQIAGQLRRRVADELSLDCSVGVGRSKLIAKLASRAAKPRADRAGTQGGDGVTVIVADEEPGFLGPLPVRALWGVGPATAKRLEELGVRTVGELATLPEQAVVRRIGKAQGVHLVALARGEDRDPVVADRPAKSIGHEETFRDDIADVEALRRHVVRMSESVARLLREAELTGRTVSLKLKYSDFSLVTRSHTVSFPIDTAPALSAVASALLDAVELAMGVRLLGISMSGLQDTSASRQLTFDMLAGGPEGVDGPQEPTPVQLQESWAEITAAVDAVRSRFGLGAVGPASMVSAAGLAVPGRRDAPWGPSAEGTDPAT